MAKKKTTGISEIEAISAVHEAIKQLNAAAQLRVLKYVAEMLNVRPEWSSGPNPNLSQSEESSSTSSTSLPSTSTTSEGESISEAEGINPIAIKWMRRSGLSSEDIQGFFSLGIDEIDLVARSVPGANKKDRMRSVLLLKGIASYLGTGVPRVSYEQLKEACLHYDAYDGTNFARNLKSFAVDAGGSKELGFTLTARGLTLRLIS